MSTSSTAVDRKTSSNKLTVKDLITVGIFTAIYAVITGVAGALGVIPIFVPLAAVIVPILGGIPLMYFLTKANKFGMLLILSVLEGLLMFVGGMGYFSLLTCVVFGLLAELILRSGNYASMSKTVLAYAVQSMWIVGNFIPFVFTRDAYLAQQATNFGPEYAAQLAVMMPEWIILVLLVVSFVSGLIGAFIGKKLYSKHFERAGIV